MKQFTLLAVILVCAFGFTGCGKSKQDSVAGQQNAIDWANIGTELASSGVSAGKKQ